MKWFSFAAAVLAVLVLSTSPAFAQEAPPAPDSAEPSEAEETGAQTEGGTEEPPPPQPEAPAPEATPDEAPSLEPSVTEPAAPEPAAPQPATPEPAGMPELPAPPSSLPEAQGDSGEELSLADWERDDWMLLQPELSLVELNGYFRVRSQFFRRLNFGNGTLGAEDPSRFEPTEEVLTDTNFTDRQDTNLNGTDMRLRIEPVINVTEKVQVITTFDVLDNLVLGSTPATSPFFRRDDDENGDPDLSDTPVNILNRTQVPPAEDVNYVRDSILVRRAYARMTALNDQLQFDIGRMPDHWGLGMMINSGDCLDCDFGDVVDRAMVGFKALGHLFQVSLTLVDGGPVTAPYNARLGPVYDLARWDDVDQYDIRVQKLDHPDDIRERVLQGETVLNYGLLTAFRLQNDGLNTEYFETDTFDPTRPLTIENDNNVDEPLFVREDRGGFLYIGDAYLKLYSGLWTVEAEAAAMIGRFTDRVLNGDLEDTNIEMFGGHLNLIRRFDQAPRTGATFAIRAGAASGDRGQGGEEGRGFGAFDQADTQRGGNDDRLTAFQFSPDFHVDQLLFRRVIGTVTDAWYVGPELRYFFSTAVEGRAGANYAKTWWNRNTPGNGRGLGVEVNTQLIFGEPSKTASGGEIFATTEAAVLFPLSGFDLGEEIDGGGDFAWSLQAKLFLTF